MGQISPKFTKLPMAEITGRIWKKFAKCENGNRICMQNLVVIRATRRRETEKLLLRVYVCHAPLHVNLNAV